jgi:hypothetical protein
LWSVIGHPTLQAAITQPGNMVSKLLNFFLFANDGASK